MMDTRSDASRPPDRRLAFGYLLAALLAYAAAYPLGGRGLARQLIAEVAVTAILVTGLGAVGRGRMSRLMILLFGVPAVVAGFSLIVLEVRWLLLVRSLFGSVFLGVTTALILKEVLRDERVTGDKITGSICGYLLLGSCWSVIYALIEAANPGSFALTLQGAEGTLPPLRELAAELTYFSFVTLTTLGYGDITPISPQARTLAWLEAGSGQIYLTVLVARLVGLHIAHSQKDPQR
jgi:hypothetical protein